MGSAAGTGFCIQHADVTGAVTQQRECLLGDAGEYQLTFGAYGKHFAGVGIDDLGNEVILIDMHAGLCFTLKGNTWAGDLRQAVDIVSLDTQAVLNILTHLLTPGFRAEDTGLQLDLIPQTTLVDGLCQISCVRGGAAQDGGAQVGHKLQLTVRIAGGHGKGQTTGLVRAAMQTHTAGEQAVAVCDMADILFAATNSGNGAGAAVFPQIHLVLGVECHHSLSGCTGGGVDTDTLIHGLANQATGIGLAQVVLGQERKLVQILCALNVRRGHTLFFHFLAVVRDIVPHMLHLLDKTLVLPGFDLLTGSSFNLGLIILCHFLLSPWEI